MIRQCEWNLAKTGIVAVVVAVTSFLLFGNPIGIGMVGIVTGIFVGCCPLIPWFIPPLLLWMLTTLLISLCITVCMKSMVV